MEKIVTLERNKLWHFAEDTLLQICQKYDPSTQSSADLQLIYN